MEAEFYNEWALNRHKVLFSKLVVSYLFSLELTWEEGKVFATNYSMVCGSVF